MPRTSWPPYRTLRGMELAHVGRAAVIMGGGDSLHGAIPKCPPDALYISVNDHGVRFLKDRPHLARACAYIVACDKLENRARADIGLPGGTLRDGEPWGLPVISRHMWADYRLLHMPAPNSGMAAAWLARFFGCAPVILTGMDLYSGVTYFDAPTAKSTGRAASPAEHLERWRLLFRRYPYQYRTIGCNKALRALTGDYAREETPAPAPAAELLRAELQPHWCRTNARVMIDQRTFEPGTELELSTIEVENLIKKRQVVRIAPPAAAL